MYQYSGLITKVANQWNDSNDYWHHYLASKGYVIVCVDGRGTGFKAQFKKLTQNQLGRFEVEDQIEAARKFGELSYIDASKIGIWGWSYGGFMSSNAILKGNDAFKAAIAVAPKELGDFMILFTQSVIWILLKITLQVTMIIHLYLMLINQG